MPRTSLTRRELRNMRDLQPKLLEHDTALDALEALTLGAGDFKQSVRLATTANHALSGTTDIDSVTPSVGNRVLAWAQTAPAENGIYVVASGAWTRATDFDASSEATAGVMTYVSEGTLHGNHVFILTTDDAITLGSTSLTFAKVPNAVDLAATTASLGASLVGIQDVGTLITATTVEGALAEIAAANWVTNARMANDSVDSAEIVALAVTNAKIANLNITANKMAVAANADVLGCVPIVYVLDLADGVTADHDIVVTNKCEIVGVTVQKRGGAGGASDTIQIKNGANAVTDAIDINDADKTISVPTTIDDAQSTIPAAGTIRVTKTKASAANVACLVTITCLPRA